MGKPLKCPRLLTELRYQVVGSGAGKVLADVADLDAVGAQDVAPVAGLVLFQISAQSQLGHLQAIDTVCGLRLIGREREFWHGRVVGCSGFLQGRLTGLLWSPRS